MYSNVNIVSLKDVQSDIQSVTLSSDYLVDAVGNIPVSNTVNFTEINKLPKYKSPSNKISQKFSDEKIYINQIDYYFSNCISRSSKVMSECRGIKLKTLKSGTDN